MLTCLSPSCWFMTYVSFIALRLVRCSRIQTEQGANLLPVGLKEFDGVARRVVQQNLFASIPIHDVVAKRCTARTQRLDETCEVIDFDLDAIPAPRRRLPSIRHGLSCSS